jgi:hypothetical protein
MAKTPQDSEAAAALDSLARMRESSIALLDLEKRRDRQLLRVDDLKRSIQNGDISEKSRKDLEQEQSHLIELTAAHRRQKQAVPRLVIDDDDDEVPFEYYDEHGRLPELPAVAEAIKHGDANEPSQDGPAAKGSSFPRIVGAIWARFRQEHPGKQPSKQPEVLTKIAAGLDTAGILLSDVISNRPRRKRNRQSKPEQSHWKIFIGEFNGWISQRMRDEGKSPKLQDFTWAEACRVMQDGRGKTIRAIILETFHEAARKWSNYTKDSSPDIALPDSARHAQSRITVMPIAQKAK